jgi:hypothetical protein
VNFEQFQQLRSVIPHDGKFVQAGRKDMSVHVGGRFEGVCLRSYHNATDSTAVVDRIIGIYLSCEDRALRIQSFLQKLD